MPAYRPYDSDERAIYEREKAVKKKKKDLCRVIREQMDEKRITKKELAAVARCHPNSMTVKLRDPGRFTGDEVFRIEAYLGIETVHNPT